MKSRSRCLPIRMDIWRHHASCSAIIQGPSQSIPTTTENCASRTAWMLHHSMIFTHAAEETLHPLSATQFRHTSVDYAVFSALDPTPRCPIRVWLLKVKSLEVDRLESQSTATTTRATPASVASRPAEPWGDLDERDNLGTDVQPHQRRRHSILDVLDLYTERFCRASTRQNCRVHGGTAI